MTKEQVKALVAAKIEGQGTNVDAGSALPAILNGILELIPGDDEQVKVKFIVESGNFTYQSGASYDEVIQAFKDGKNVTIEAYDEEQDVSNIGRLIDIESEDSGHYYNLIWVWIGLAGDDPTIHVLTSDAWRV